MSFIKELNRRNVFRVAAAYVVISWLLIQVADTLTPALRLPESLVSAITLILILGFIPTLLFSWAYEITPDGVKKESEVDRTQSVTAQTAKKLDIITLIALIGVVALVAWQQLQPTVNKASEIVDKKNETIELTPPQKPKKNDVQPKEQSIAVLPFADMSQDADQEYFADGISEEILNALVKATGLRVAGRTSSFSFKGKDSTIKEIAEALNVAHVLEGSIRKQGNSVRITAQLIKADDGFHLWSETYNGSLDNIFELQDQISRQVTEELKLILNLNANERLASKMTTDIDAYDLFLRGREAVSKRIGGNLEKGLILLQKAVELDPNFAEAWAVLAEAEVVSVGYIKQTIQETKASDLRAENYAQTAISLNESLALPHAVRGLLLANAGQYLESIAELELALKLEATNSIANRWLGNIYSELNYNQRAMSLYQRTYSIDPLSSINTYNLAATHFKLGNAEQAIRYFTITGDLRGSIMPQVSQIYQFLGESETAKKWMYDFIDLESSRGLRDAYVSQDDLETLIDAMFGGTETQKAAARKLNTILIKGDDDTGIWQLEHHLAIGNIDRVYEILQQKPSFFGSFATDFMWLPSEGTKAFRADPRFKTLLIKHKLPDAWLALGWPEHCKPIENTNGSNGQFICQ